MGFRLGNDTFMYTYKQERNGLSYLNPKRIVCRNGNNSRSLEKVYLLSSEWILDRVDIMDQIIHQKYFYIDVRKSLYKCRNKKIYYCLENDIFWGIGMGEDEAMIVPTLSYKSG